MKKYILFIAIILVSLLGFSQGENNIWTFGKGYSLNFNSGVPILKDTVYVNGVPHNAHTLMPNNKNNYVYAQAVCDAGGQLLFIVKNNVGQNTANIFDRNENPISGTSFLYSVDPLEGRPVIVKHPGNANQYYIFYARNSGLLYCLFDMSLNNGFGAIVPGQKNILISNYNTVLFNRLTAMQGCRGVWLIARHKVNNQYLSFEINQNGLVQTPVISETGLLPVATFWGDGGLIVGSPNGKLMAASYTGGYDHLGAIELYNFERCSGKVKNARLLDTGVAVYGLCFSPDNSKLYVTQSDSMFNSTFLFYQRVYQYDFNQLNIPAIAATKTLVIDNPVAHLWSVACPATTNMLGALKVASDGSLYLSSNHPAVCPGTGPGMTIHVIKQPNLLGLSSQPLINNIYNFDNGMYNSNYGPTTDMPKDIFMAPVDLPDTFVGTTKSIAVCFADEAYLKAPDFVSCLTWNDGSIDTVFKVIHSGKYWLTYYKDCDVFTDSFDVRFIPLPDFDKMDYGCDGNINFSVKPTTETYTYDFKNDRGVLLYTASTKDGWEVNGLDAGKYYLTIEADPGCDTTIEIALIAFPKPEIWISPSDTTIAYGNAVRIKANGASFYAWSPARFLDNPSGAEVFAKPDETSVFRVVGVNDYGCWDTAYAKVNIDGQNAIIVPNAFTPNGDGRNDIFNLVGIGIKSIRLFEIYNRYGQLVYSGTYKGWDGTYKGKPCEMGVYQYMIHVDYLDGSSKSFKGDINLIR